MGTNGYNANGAHSGKAPCDQDDLVQLLVHARNYHPQASAQLVGVEVIENKGAHQTWSLAAVQRLCIRKEKEEFHCKLYDLLG